MGKTEREPIAEARPTRELPSCLTSCPVLFCSVATNNAISFLHLTPFRRNHQTLSSYLHS